jgi:hypothetical protein
MVRSRFNEPIEPMTVGNRRANGVRSPDVFLPPSYDPGRGATPDNTLEPTFGPRMACTRCGIVSADARPNCREQPQRESLTAFNGGER